MHIKPGTWVANNAVCESDSLCDPAVLVSAPKPEPHIRNRRLSPGSGSCGGGGGGGCAAGVDKRSTRQTSLSSSNESLTQRTGHTQVFISSLHREQRTDNRAYRSSRALRSAKTDPLKERCVGNTLSSLKPPPAFPVKDSPAKLQPEISYAAKVKSGGSGGVVEEPPGIKVLLENQWGLSFISNCPTAEILDSVAPQGTAEMSPTATSHPVAGEMTTEISPPPSFMSSQIHFSVESANSEELLLSCPHLEEAVKYHTREWSAILQKQKQDPGDVVWFKDSL
ncbi:uncharacterized protein si:ch211-214j24.10 [Hoplias malabaricus]|uniref:uncharacterized protein si:ch211-214j24.10 n=1 Tax=Hoplias malabaricus TaxID=27720 RepID=UPI003461BAA7